MMKYIRRIPPVGYLALAIIIVAASGYLLFRDLAENGQAQIRIEIIKALISLPIILILGGIISQIFKFVDERRDDAKALAEFREEMRKRLGEAYAGAKRCRRLLRVAGFTEELFDKPRPMSKELLDAYSNQLELINEIQLDLEKLWQEMDCFRCAFSSSDPLLRRVKLMSGYLRGLVDEYEKHWASLTINHGEHLSTCSLKALQQFTGPTNKGLFKDKYCDRYSEAVKLIRQDLLRAK